MKKKFANVFAVAWDWNSPIQGFSPLKDVVMSYKKLIKKVDLKNECRCNPVPEIKAAIDTFATSREARESIYVFIDIGGGTLDGAAFQLYRKNGVMTVNFLSGKVELG